MGHAGTAPKSIYQRKYRISEHARDRFRERGAKTWGSLDNESLCNVLDERMRFSEEKPVTVRDPRAPAAITTLQPFDYEGQMLYVVVRENVAITVLDESQAKNNFQGTWTPVLNAPFAEALRGVTPVRGTPAPAPRFVDVAKLEKNLAASVVEVEPDAWDAITGGAPNIPLADVFRAASEQYENAVFAARAAKKALAGAIAEAARAQQAVDTAKEVAAQAAERIELTRAELLRLESVE